MAQFHRIGRRFGLAGRRLRRFSWSLIVLMAFLAASCATPDPKALLRVSDVETYWVLDPSRTEMKYLAPAVRFRVENISQETLIAVDATAAFLRDGSNEPWGSGFFRLTEGRKRLEPGAKALVTMSSDARYSLEGDPATAFTHPTFKSVNTKFFLRVGSSVWIEFGRSSVENVIGSKDARAVLSQPVP
ncbi:MAG: hypothetical protein ABI565_06950 [Vicinamibacteria bacterium]